VTDRIPVDGLPPQGNQTLLEKIAALEERLALLEQGPTAAGIVTRDTYAIEGQTLVIDPPPAGLTIALPEARGSNQGRSVQFFQRSVAPVRIQAIKGTVNGLPQLISNAKGAFSAVSDGYSGWSVPAFISGGGVGLPGVPGAAGNMGIQGQTGDEGPEGPQGFPGATGPAGPTGPTGPQGIQGIQGFVGQDGQDGVDGLIGPKGDTGPAGATGATGPAGGAGVYTLMPDAFGPDQPPTPEAFPLGFAAALQQNPRGGASSPVIDGEAGAMYRVRGSSSDSAATIGTQIGTNNAEFRGGSNAALIGGSAAVTGSSTTVTITAANSVSVVSGVSSNISLSAGGAANATVQIPNGSLCLTEQATSAFSVPAGDGMYWVRNNAPNEGWFTDDTNVDVPLLNRVVRKTAATTVSAATTALDLTGTYTIPANTLVVGSCFEFIFNYQFIRGATATAMTLATIFNVGAGVNINQSTPTAAGTYDLHCQALMTVLTTGAGGTCMVTLRVYGPGITTAADAAARYGSNVALAIDTTVPFAINCTAQMSAGVAATQTRCMGGFIRQVA
jgi:Collagen triple helix repeat (20 copies)